MIQRSYLSSAPIPFYLPDGKVFVPLKMRAQYIKGHKSYGYLVANLEIASFSELTNDHKHSNLLLKNRAQNSIFSSITTVRAMLYLRHKIHHRYFAFNVSEKNIVLDAAKILLGRMERLDQKPEKL